MMFPLVPMNLGDLFDRTFRLLGRTFGRSAIIALILLAPTALLFSFALGSFIDAVVGLAQGPYDLEPPDLDQLASMVGAAGLMALTGILLGLAHGGMAPGIDRLVMLMADEPNIREVLSFPKTASGSDLMFDAPAEIDEKQLRELKINLDGSP